MKRAKVDGGASKKRKCEQFNEILPLVLNYLPGPIVGVLAQVCVDWRKLILSRLESYCHDLCPHYDMCNDHHRCLYQIYDFWQRGFITQERYETLRLRWGFSDDYLFFRGGVMWMPEIGDRERSSVKRETFFNLHSYLGRGLFCDFALHPCDIDETEFISIPLYKKVFSALACKTGELSLPNLLQSRVPIPVIEYLIVQKKISRWWGTHHPYVFPVDHIAKLLRSPYDLQLREICKNWPVCAIDWRSSNICKYRPAIDALVETVAGRKTFIINYRGGLDESLDEILDLAVQGPIDFEFTTTALEFERVLDAKGFLSSTHWNQYVKFGKVWPNPDFQRISYLLMHKKLHFSVIRRFELDVRAEDDISLWLCHLIGTCNDEEGSLGVDPRCEEVLFFIKQLGSAITAWNYQDLVGRIYFPGPAPPELLIFEPIVEVELSAYNYLWLRHHSTTQLLK